MVKLKLI